MESGPTMGLQTEPAQNAGTQTIGDVMASRTPNKKNLRMWVRALRSGQYEQGKTYMAKDGKYCCLGVAQDIAIANGAKAVFEAGKTATMPAAVCEWLGLDNAVDPVLIEVGAERWRAGTTASRLNDAGVPFAEIADRIEYTFQLDSDD